MAVTNKASEVWKFLNGVFCVYKPAGVNIYQLRKMLTGNICRDLNQLEVRPPSKIVVIEENESNEFAVKVKENLADSPLAVGPRYQNDDMSLTWATFLGKKVSGVLMMGINGGTNLAYKLHLMRPIRTYHLKGILGKLSENMYIDGKILQKACYAHVRRYMMDTVLASMQAAHQKSMYHQSNLDIQSQAAYELALQGPVRPSDGSIPVMYSIRCVHFEPPDFTVEVQCINENETFLLTFIHDIGLRLRTAATCTGIRCIRHSHFSVEDALLRKHWTVQHIIDNISHCNQVIENNKHLIQNRPPAIQKLSVT